MTIGRKHPYLVTLSCGHSFKTSENPLNVRTTYPCKYGTGCGYRLLWVSYEDVNTGHVKVNP